MKSAIKIVLFISIFTALFIFNSRSFAQQNYEKTGLYIKAEAGSFAEIVNHAVSKSRKSVKTNKFYTALLDLLEKAAAYKLSEIKLYVPQDTGYKDGMPYNFAVYIKGNFGGSKPGDAGLAFLKSPFCEATTENGLNLLKFHFMTENNFEEVIKSIDFDGHILVKLVINFLITALIDTGYDTVYSIVILDDTTAVFSSEDLIEKIVRDKAIPFDPASPAGGTAENLIYFKNPGKIIAAIADEIFGGTVNKNIADITEIKLFHDPTGGIFEAGISFEKPVGASETAAFIDKTKTMTAEKLQSAAGISPVANFETSREVFLQVKNILDSLAVKLTGSNEIILSVKYTETNSLKYREFFNNASAFLAFTAVSFLNLAHFRNLAIEKSCESNMKTIDGACELYIMELDKTPENLDELVIKEYMESKPECPSKGKYSISAAGEKAVVITCSKHGGIEKE